jgi:hypothetical protein
MQNIQICMTNFLIGIESAGKREAATCTRWFPWPLFGEGNGAASLEQMLARIGPYRRAPIAPGEDPVIGCVFIRDVCFLPPDEAAPPPPDFSADIVQGKSYDLSQRPAAAYFSPGFSRGR